MTSAQRYALALVAVSLVWILTSFYSVQERFERDGTSTAARSDFILPGHSTVGPAPARQPHPVQIANAGDALLWIAWKGSPPAASGTTRTHVRPGRVSVAADESVYFSPTEAQALTIRPVLGSSSDGQGEEGEGVLRFSLIERDGELREEVHVDVGAGVSLPFTLTTYCAREPNANGSLGVTKTVTCSFAQEECPPLKCIDPLGRKYEEERHLLADGSHHYLGCLSPGSARRVACVDGTPQPDGAYCEWIKKQCIVTQNTGTDASAIVGQQGAVGCARSQVVSMPWSAQNGIKVTFYQRSFEWMKKT